VKRDDNILEENYMFIPERHGEPTVNTRQNVEQLSGTVELVVFVDEGEEAFVDCLSDHLPSGHEFGVQFVEDVLEVVSLDRLFRVKKFQEFLDELWSDINFERSHLNCLVDHELEEEFVNSLEMGPCGVDLVFLLDSRLGELKVRFLHIGKGSEDVLLNHGHNII